MSHIYIYIDNLGYVDKITDITNLVKIKVKMAIVNGNVIFEDLFVLEMANNHWGNVERGLKIINDYGKIVRFNNVKAAIKLQFRDVDKFIHKDYKNRTDVRYIAKTLATKLEDDEFRTLVGAIRKNGCIPMATPFDERSVDLCMELGIDIIKIASSDINDWILIEKIATQKKPVMVSTGGASMKSTDDLVKFFDNRNIPLAINHCVSIYPSEDTELELNQVDYLRDRYPNHVIGFSSHEYSDWAYSMMIAYSKGARTFERHVDIDADGIPVSPYCSLPYQIDTWFKAFHKVKQMSGGPSNTRRVLPIKEVNYLDQLVRGVYAKNNLPKGHVLTSEDVYLAIPLLKGQISCRELMAGEVLLNSIEKDKPIFVDMIEGPYAHNETLKKSIYERGVDINIPIITEKKKTTKGKKHKKEKIK